LNPARAPRNLRLLQAFAYAEQDEVLLETAPDGVFIGELSLRLTRNTAVTRTEVEPGYACWLPEADEVLTPTGVVAFDRNRLQRVEGVEPARWMWSD
jgi:hypothetical protein